MKVLEKTVCFVFVTAIFFLFQEPFAGKSLAKNKLVAGGCVTEYYLMKDLTDKFNSDELSIDIRKTGYSYNFSF